MSVVETDLPEGKKTAQGLYVTAREAYAMWQEAPEEITIIDVRTPEEYLFVGYPTMAWKIPVIAQSYTWDAEQEKYPMRLLEDFVARVSEVATPESKIMLMCRAGGRSAMAANLLAQAGFGNVYNIVDGMEGDINGSSESVAQSTQPAGGWKNSDCPWTKKLTPERMVLVAAVDRVDPID